MEASREESLPCPGSTDYCKYPDRSVRSALRIRSCTSIPFMMCTVGIGEIISCAVLGMVLYFALKNTQRHYLHSKISITDNFIETYISKIIFFIRVRNLSKVMFRTPPRRERNGLILLSSFYFLRQSRYIPATPATASIPPAFALSQS